MLVCADIEHRFAKTESTEQEQVKSVSHFDTMNVQVALLEVVRRQLLSAIKGEGKQVVLFPVLGGSYVEL